MAFFNTWYIKLQGESTSQDLSLWGVQTHVSAEIAKPKTSYQDVFGLNGAIDRSDIGTGVKYKNRTIKMYIVIRDEDIPAASGFENANEVYEAFARKYHGQRVEISRPTDSIGGNWQRYKGRLQVSKDSKTTVVRLVTCTIEADPFVYYEDGAETVTPTYKTKITFSLTEASKIEDGGLTVNSVSAGRTYFNQGAVGRYAVWGLTVSAGEVIFPSVIGSINSYYAEFFNSDDEEIDPYSGYYSEAGETIKIKITATLTNGFNVGVDYYLFSYSDGDIAKIDGLKMPSDIYYQNWNPTTKLFLNGNIFDMEVTNAGYQVFIYDQLMPEQKNWLAILAAAPEDVATLDAVRIKYDSKDLVGVPDV